MRRGPGHYRFQVGLQTRGERNRRAKLTAVQVEEIKRRTQAGETCAAVARSLKVHPNTAVKIRNRQSWAYGEDKVHTVTRRGAGEV